MLLFRKYRLIFGIRIGHVGVRLALRLVSLKRFAPLAGLQTSAGMR